MIYVIYVGKGTFEDVNSSIYLGIQDPAFTTIKIALEYMLNSSGDYIYIYVYSCRIILVLLTALDDFFYGDVCCLFPVWLEFKYLV